ncbi:MAG: hypothetical protein JSR31_12085 [Nitrospira sp.]|nr:hypothetical protein [Nitrospira sp.]
MEKVTSIAVENDLDQTTHEEPERIWRERAIAEEDLFYGEDGAGWMGWFLRLSLTGMYPRRIGAFHTREEALDVLEAVAYQFEVEIMTEIQNDLESHQVCIQEGVAPLTATAHA